MNDEINILQKMIDESKKIVFFGGAGVSTESGIPDFRSVDGLYHQKYAYPPEEILSNGFFYRHTDYFYKFYKEKMIMKDARPNYCHMFLKILEDKGKLSAIVTQNIDGLHSLAGCKHIYELHGSVKRNYCLACGKFYDEDYILAAKGVPRCPCGGLIKPDVVLYSEPLNDETLYGAIKAIKEADCLIVAGTSLTVYPAAGLINYYQGDRLILINKDLTAYDHYANLVIHAKVGEVFKQIKLD